MRLEFAAEEAGDHGEPYPIRLDGLPAVDWQPVIRGLMADQNAGVSPAVMAARVWDTMAGAILAVARVARKPVVALGGGCFQNALLLERTVAHLREEGFTVVWPCLLPPNDGGLALGQAAVATAVLAGHAS
jgi:hydrogenase maturation protein HypF